MTILDPFVQVQTNCKGSNWSFSVVTKWVALHFSWVITQTEQRNYKAEGSSPVHTVNTVPVLITLSTEQVTLALLSVSIHLRMRLNIESYISPFLTWQHTSRLLPPFQQPLLVCPATAQNSFSNPYKGKLKKVFGLKIQCVLSCSPTLGTCNHCWMSISEAAERGSRWKDLWENGDKWGAFRALHLQTCVLLS